MSVMILTLSGDGKGDPKDEMKREKLRPFKGLC
jgi:hypothetical protein